IYNLGDGHDSILEGYLGGWTDRLILGEGILPSEVKVSHPVSDFEDIVLTFSDGGTITLDEEFAWGSAVGVEEIHFADETIWTKAMLPALSVASESTDANDVINGFDIADTIVGGLGDDTIYGRGGNDIFQYALGDGDDVINEYSNNGEDVLELGAGILPAAVTFTRSSPTGNTVTLGFTDGGSIQITDGLTTTYQQGIEQITFADETAWTKTELRAGVLAAAKTSGNDSIYGFGSDDFIDGGLGNDTLTGYGGNDTFVYSLGDGDDVVYEYSAQGDNDKLQLGAGILPSEVALVRSSPDGVGVTLEFVDGGSVYIDNGLNHSWQQGLESVVFADATTWTKDGLRELVLAAAATNGNDTIYGFNNIEDVIEGGLGDDTLAGYSANDTYVYELGDGDDVINEVGGGGDADTLQLGSGVIASEVTVVRPIPDGGALTLEFIDGGSVKIAYGADGTWQSGVEIISFAGGPTWTKSGLQQMLLDEASTSGNDTIYGYTKSNDVIIGGLGDDALRGLDGNDDYVFGENDGNDLVDESGPWYDTDRILFDSSVSPGDILLSRAVDDSNDVIATNVNTGATIRIDDQRVSTSLGIEQIVFEDNTIWDRATIETLSGTGAPVVIDLDGDGVELISSQTSRVRFDFDGDGVKERGGWVGRDDGFLVLDRNGDGKVSGMSEISFLGDLPGARSDLEGLGAFDSDGDGALTAADAEFGSFLVWQDRNGNGRSDRGELKSLADLGIASLSPVGLAPSNAAPVSLDDNTVLRVGAVEWADGSKSDLADVALRYSEEPAPNNWRADLADAFFNAILQQSSATGGENYLADVAKSSGHLRGWFELDDWIGNPASWTSAGAAPSLDADVFDAPLFGAMIEANAHRLFNASHLEKFLHLA
ncbi:MAG: calcium-binding protein, partial [Amphiplicatus sp.]